MKIERGTGNVFADLGCAAAKERTLKFRLALEVNWVLNERKLTQAQASELLGIVQLTLPSPRLALRRIAARVRQGGHNVPKTDVIRRFRRSWENFQAFYRPLADVCTTYDNAGEKLQLLDDGP